MVKSFKILSRSPSQTKKIGQILAKEILSMRKAQPSPTARGMRMRPCEFLNQRKRAFVLGLIGDLGGGKTTFLQGFAKGLGIKEKILSPSFVILKKFKVKSLGFKVFYHIDCYRIKKPKEILDLGFKEIVSDPKNIVAIEWADRIKKILPKKILVLKFDFINRNQREISMRKA
jgi:tRNA threonylcarbamoyladenosine biosynthesis protein TsaE